MTDSQHTPGPWKVVPSVPQEGSDCFWIKAATPGTRGFTKEIASSDGYQHEEERKANAALIAAAPELLEVLRGVKEVIEYNEWKAPVTMMRIERALAKARGEADD